MLQRDPRLLFVVVWGAVTFVLFSLAGSKRAVYLLPAYPAYAMLVGVAWSRLVRQRPGPLASALLAAGGAASAVLLVLLASIVVAGASGLATGDWLRGLVSDADVNNVGPMLDAAREHRAVVLPCALVMAGCAWVTLAALRRGGWARVFAATVVATLALSATVSTTLLPAIASKRSTRSFLARVSELVPDGVPLSFYRAFDYGAVFYRGAPIPVRQALSDVPSIDGAWLLTWPATLPDLSEEARRLDTGSEAAGAYEVEEVLAASEDHDPSDRSSLVLVRIQRRIGQATNDEHSGGN